jgi:hypothetical protein
MQGRSKQKGDRPHRPYTGEDSNKGTDKHPDETVKKVVQAQTDRETLQDAGKEIHNETLNSQKSPRKIDLEEIFKKKVGQDHR